VAVAVGSGHRQRWDDHQHVARVSDRQPGGEEEGDGRCPGQQRLARLEDGEEDSDQDGDPHPVAEGVLGDEPQLLERAQAVLAGLRQQDAEVTELAEKEGVERSGQCEGDCGRRPGFDEAPLNQQ